MARYGALNSETNMMNFYASRVERSYFTAKKKIARLTAMFKTTYESNNINNNSSLSRHQNNPNIIKDPVVMRTNGSSNSRHTREDSHADALIGIIRRPRICRTSSGFGHDA